MSALLRQTIDHLKNTTTSCIAASFRLPTFPSNRAFRFHLCSSKAFPKANLANQRANLLSSLPTHGSVDSREPRHRSSRGHRSQQTRVRYSCLWHDGPTFVDYAMEARCSDAPRRNRGLHCRCLQVHARRHRSRWSFLPAFQL